MAKWLRDYKINHPELNSYHEKKRDQNSIHYIRPDGKVEIHAVSAPVFWDDNGTWSDIDTEDIRDNGTEYWVPGVPAKITKSNKKIVSVDGLYSQATSNIGRFRPSTETFTQLWTIPAGSISGDSIVSSGPNWSHKITFRYTGITEEIVIQSNPGNMGSQPGDYVVIETKVEGMTFPDGWLDHFEFNNLQFPMPQAYDADGKRVECKRYSKNISGDQYLYTGILIESFSDITFPLIIDPDFSSSTASYYEIEGYQYLSYSGARSTSDNIYGGTTVNWGQSNIVGGYYCNRVALKFNTSSIPSGATVTSVKMKMAVTVVDSPSQDMLIVKYNWSASDPLSSGNQETIYDGILSGTLDDSIWKNTSSITTNTYYESGELSTAWVNISGSTYYGLICYEDRNNSAPSGLEGVTLCSPSHGTYPPVLVITYIAGSILFFPF